MRPPNFVEVLRRATGYSGTEYPVQCTVQFSITRMYTVLEGKKSELDFMVATYRVSCSVILVLDPLCQPCE